MSSEKIPVILDTDIGTDIDDALCLAYLLKQPKCDLLGITTECGDTIARAKLASCICRRANRDEVPIYPGAPMPFIGSQGQAIVPQATALDKWDHHKEFSENCAIPFLRDTIRSRPGEITLLTIGPLTNIGVLFALYPDIPGLLKSLVLMCGSFYDGQTPRRRECNAVVDHIATDVVYRANVKQHISIGLDVTMECIFTGDVARERIQGGILAPVADMASVWLENANHVVFHDPLTAALLFEPSLCELKRGEVTIDPIDGVTYWSESSEGRHQVAKTVDSSRFIEHYFAITKG